MNSGQPLSPAHEALVAAGAQVAIVRGPSTYDDSQAITRLVATAIESVPTAGELIRPGDRVVIKPNWVKEYDTRRPGRDSWQVIVTHPEVILGTIRWIAPRLQGRGSITICDAPQNDSSFEKIIEYCGINELVAKCQAEFPGITFAVYDLRAQDLETIEGVTISRRVLPGDPAGSINIHLDEASEFIGYRGLGKLYGAAYDFAETNRQHQDPHHEYLISRTPLEADVLVNVPKLKTHKKVGVTVALKNMVGITARTNWLPRHTDGTPDEGGDEFSESTTKRKVERRLMRVAKRLLAGNYKLSRFFVPLKRVGKKIFGDTAYTVRNGNWHGNDTAWRMILDLHKCIFHYDGAGQRRASPPRQLIVVDGIVGGEGDGPMCPDAKACGVILAGVNPVAIDCAAATLMGFDWRKLKLLTHAFRTRQLAITDFSPEDLRVISPEKNWHGPLDNMQATFEFVPHFGWKGMIERRGAASGKSS